MDPIPAPPPINPTPGDTRPYWKRLLATYLPYLIPLVLGYVTHWMTAQPKTVEVPVPAPPPAFLGEAGRPFVSTDTGEFKPTFGWVVDDAKIAMNLDPVQTDHFDQTPAGKAVMGDEDVFLWQAVRKVNNRGPPWYPNVDQRDVGCCVGCGWKHSADICEAFAIASGRFKGDWKPTSVEAIYGLSRVEIGGGKIRGDGSVGAWAKEGVEKFGVVAMEAYPAADLTVFSPARARAWGTSGLPNALEPVAKEHPVKGAALVKSWADVKRAIQQGYPVAVCSNVGFTMGRDKDGFARATGTWNHCMCICGVRTGPREGAFILNSWGDTAHTGPVWPSDAPVAGFWADAAVIDRMAKQGDSFALADIVGFPARVVPIDWFGTE